VAATRTAARRATWAAARKVAARKAPDPTLKHVT
jgi:hypothetical protein